MDDEDKNKKKDQEGEPQQQEGGGRPSPPPPASFPNTIVFRQDEDEGEETTTVIEDEQQLDRYLQGYFEADEAEEPEQVEFMDNYYADADEELPGEAGPTYAFEEVGFPPQDEGAAATATTPPEEQEQQQPPPPLSPTTAAEQEQKFDWSKVGYAEEEEEEDEEQEEIVSYDKLKPHYGELKPSEDGGRGRGAVEGAEAEKEEEILVKYGSTVEETMAELQDIRQSMRVGSTASEEELLGEFFDGRARGGSEDEEEIEKLLKQQQPHHHHHRRHRHRTREEHERRCRSLSEAEQSRHGGGPADDSGAVKGSKHPHHRRPRSHEAKKRIPRGAIPIDDEDTVCTRRVFRDINEEAGIREKDQVSGRPCTTTTADATGTTARETCHEEEEGDDLGPPDRVSIKDLDEMIRLLRANNESGLDDEEGEESVQRRQRAAEADEAAATGRTGTSAAEDGETRTSTTAAAAAAEGLEEERLVVLGPNHPKMKRFQEALKAHLQKQLYLAQCESKDLQKELKLTKKERQDTGANLYNLQYELARQTETLTKHEKQLEKMSERKLEMEELVEERRVQLTHAKEVLKGEMAKEETLIAAARKMDLLEWCVRAQVEEHEHQLTIAEQMDEKTVKEKDQAELNKKSQDYYLDKIMSHVERMEQANDGIKRQISAHLEEQKDLTGFINEAQTEIEALQIEKVHLQRAWNETLTVIRARDDAFNAAASAVKESKELIRQREAELRYLNRVIAREQVKHEHATMLLKRRQLEDRQLNSQIAKLNGHVEQLESQLAMMQQMRMEVEAEYLRVSNELAHLGRDATKPRKHYESLCNKKRALEDKILKDIQDKTAMDKIASHIAKKIEKARGKTREMEFQLVKIENEMTKLTATVEKLRTDVLKKSTAVEELEKKMAAQEQVINDQINDLKLSEKNISRKTNELEKMNRKLQKLIAERGSDTETGPLENEIDELEKQIVAARNTCVELQEDWLKLQDKVVLLTSQREEIANANELVRKETFIIERKKQRLEIELLSKEVHTEKLKKEIELTKAQIVRLNGKLSANHVEETQLGRDNILIQNELVLQLRDAEMEAVEMEQDIESLEKEKEGLNATLAEAHDQCLIWEKKVKLVKEVKESVKNEHENTTGALKLAIHHMKVRYHELMRVQEKLMSDLEQTVDKRELIIQKSEFELQRSNVNPSKTKLNIQRNFKKILEKNRKLIKDAKNSEIDVKNTEKRIAMLNERLECDASALKSLKEVIELSDEKIAEAAISKHKNLIELICRQRKYKILESINLCQYKAPWFSGISCSEIERLIRDTEDRCYALAELCDELLQEYPENGLQIKLIKASIFSHVK